MDHNFHGICLDYGSIYNIIQSNIISANQQAGVMLEYYSNNNKIIKNNFLHNRICNGFVQQSFHNMWKENYWHDWIGLNSSLLKVLPKIIEGQLIEGIPLIQLINFDWHPAQRPNNTADMC